MMMDWVRTEPDHLILMNNHLASQKILGNGSLLEVAEDSALAPLLATHARTLRNEVGDPILCVGVWPQWPGVSSVWMLVTAEALLDHSIKVIRGSWRFMRGIVQRDGLHRLQAYVYPSHSAGVRFAEHYGFLNEGTMKQFSQEKEDLCLYARTF